MLRYKTKLDLVQSPYTTSGQETERVYSYNLGAHTGPTGVYTTDSVMNGQYNIITNMTHWLWLPTQCTTSTNSGCYQITQVCSTAEHGKISESEASMQLGWQTLCCRYARLETYDRPTNSPSPSNFYTRINGTESYSHAQFGSAYNKQTAILWSISEKSQ